MVIDFHLDVRSGVSPYQQLVQQVQRALRLGLLAVGDQLPTVKEVAAKLAINPNTVLKAYRELEHLGLVSPRPGLGTFVTRSLADDTLAAHEPLRRELLGWLERALRAGLDPAAIEALFLATFREARPLHPESRKFTEVNP
jgi:GntR family transcriptional regulator